MISKVKRKTEISCPVTTRCIFIGTEFGGFVPWRRAHEPIFQIPNLLPEDGGKKGQEGVARRGQRRGQVCCWL